MIIIGISMLGMAISANYIILLVSYTIFAFGITIFMPAGTALLSERVPVNRLGFAMGVYGLFENLGAVIGPIIGGILWSAWMPKSLFLVIGSVTLCIAVTLFIINKTRITEKMSD